jgi:hypothetical protein
VVDAVGAAGPLPEVALEPGARTAVLRTADPAATLAIVLAPDALVAARALTAALAALTAAPRH